MVLRPVKISYLVFDKSVILLPCAFFVATSCLLLYDKESEIQHDVCNFSKLMVMFLGLKHKKSNTMPSIDTDILPPYYPGWIRCEKLATTRSE